MQNKLDLRHLLNTVPLSNRLVGRAFPNTQMLNHLHEVYINQWRRMTFTMMVISERRGYDGRHSTHV